MMDLRSHMSAAEVWILGTEPEDDGSTPYVYASIASGGLPNFVILGLRPEDPVRWRVS